MLPFLRLAAWVSVGLFIVSCGDAGDYAAETDRLEATESVDQPVETEATAAADVSKSPVLDLSAMAAQQPATTVTPAAAPTSDPTTPASSSPPITAPTAAPSTLGSTAAAPTDAPSEPAPQPGTAATGPAEQTTTVAPPEPLSTTTTAASVETPTSEVPPTDTTPASTPAPPVAAVSTGQEPNCAVLCNVAMEGDSLTVGLGTRLCQAVQTGACINSGIVGRRVDEMIVTARTDVDNIVGSGNHDVIILWAGTNDLWQKFHSTNPPVNAAAVYENIKVFVAERRANGWDRVLVMTLPPMNQQYVVGTDDLNALIRQNGAGADGVIDVGADPRLANEFDRAMRAADGIHFGDGGRAVVMEHVLAAVRALDGA